LLFLACGAHADSDADAEKMIIERTNAAILKIPHVIEQYGTSIGCAFSFDQNNIVDFKVEENGVGMSTFRVAVFNLDVGCSGGSAMSRPVFVQLQLDAFWSNFLINPNVSIPKLTSQNFPQYIKNIYIEDGQIMFLGWDKINGSSKGQVIFSEGKWQPKNITYLDKKENLH
jgi:hypothetical protein